MGRGRDRRGTDESAARAAEAATTAFYTGVPQEGAEQEGTERGHGAEGAEQAAPHA